MSVAFISTFFRIPHPVSLHTDYNTQTGDTKEREFKVTKQVLLAQSFRRIQRDVCGFAV